MRHLIIFIYLCLFISCRDNDQPAPDIPDVPVNEDINLNDARFQSLKFDKGFAYIQDAGYKGIVILRLDDGNYAVFDRSCTYRPQDSCAIVEMDDSGFYLIDHCCSSTFGTDGYPTGGPAGFPLKPYNISQEGDFLFIRN